MVWVVVKMLEYCVNDLMVVIGGATLLLYKYYMFVHIYAWYITIHSKL